jgi:hypothetical protein
VPPPEVDVVVTLRESVCDCESVWDWEWVSDWERVSDADRVWLENELEDEDPPTKPPCDWVFDQLLDAPVEATVLSPATWPWDSLAKVDWLSDTVSAWPQFSFCARLKLTFPPIVAWASIVIPPLIPAGTTPSPRVTSPPTLPPALIEEWTPPPKVFVVPPPCEFVWPSECPVP